MPDVTPAKQTKREEEIADLLAKTLKGKLEDRRDAIRKLGRRNAQQAIPTLIGLLYEEDNWRIRSATAVSLGKIGNPIAIPALTAALKDESTNVRKRTVTALGRIGGREAIGVLFGAFTDNRESVRRDTVAALIGLGTAAVIGPLVQQLQDEDERHKEMAAQTLIYFKIVDRTTPHAVLATPDLNGQQRWLALNILRASERTRLFSPLANLEKFCQQAYKGADAGLHAGARQVLDYTSLARPSSRVSAEEQHMLLRAAQGASSSGGHDFLLRATEGDEDDTEEEESQIRPLPLRPTLFERLRTLFRRA